MVTWILFVLLLEAEKYYVMSQGQYLTMKDCFEAREIVMQSAPQPKMNYEAICVQTNQITPPEDWR